MEIDVHILNPGDKHPNPKQDHEWLHQSNIMKTFVIKSATIQKFDDGRYPQIQLVAQDPVTKKFISIGATARILNMIVMMARGAAESQGLRDF